MGVSAGRSMGWLTKYAECMDRMMENQMERQWTWELRANGHIRIYSLFGVVMSGPNND